MDGKSGFPVAKPVVQFYDTTPGNTVSRPSPESRQDTTVKIPAETPETGSTELETVSTVYIRQNATIRATGRSRRLNQDKGLKKEKFCNTTVKTEKTMTCLNDGTGRERQKRMQKRAQPDIRRPRS